MKHFSFSLIFLSLGLDILSVSGSQYSRKNIALISNERRLYNGVDATLRIRGGSILPPNSSTRRESLKKTLISENRNRNALIVEKGGASTTSNEKASKFPISVSELPHFLSMSFMMFLFIYVFTTVRDTKDTLVVSNCGAEAIPFLKLYGVMPSAMMFIVGYSKLSNMVGKKTLFYLTLLPFFAFYTIFAFVLYPMRDSIHGIFGSGIESGVGSSVVSLVKYWSFSLYFIISELWGAAGVPLLFWTCANDVTNLAQAKRFYPLFAVIGNLAPVVSGKVMSAIVARQKSNDDAAFGETLKILASVKLLVCAGIIAFYRSVHARAEKSNTGEQKVVKKKNLPLSESLKELSQSLELRSIATMVICYNVCIELTEVVWKGLLRKLYTNKSDYMAYMANFSQTVGIVAFLLQLCATSIISGLGWKWAAMVTPLAMVALAIPFFFLVAFGEKMNIPLTTILLIGTIQNVISKVTKYTLFDPCKEMAYIPLGPEAKVKGKAGVDVMGSRLGRSLGSASQQLLVLGFAAGGSILECAPSLGVFYVIAIGAWSRSVGILGKLFGDRKSVV